VFDFSAAWTFSSGNTYTLSLEEYPSLSNEEILPDYGKKGQNLDNIIYSSHLWIERYASRNNYRIPPAHRLDISLNYYRKKSGKGRQGIWNFTVFNVYNQPTPYFIYPGFSDKKGRYVITQLSLLPVLPSFSYTYKF
jgi:hypothetical protein